MARRITGPHVLDIEFLAAHGHLSHQAAFLVDERGMLLQYSVLA